MSPKVRMIVGLVALVVIVGSAVFSYRMLIGTAPDAGQPAGRVVAPSGGSGGGGGSAGSTVNTPRPGGKNAPAAVVNPAARAALAKVGTDANAESTWREAINDPKLPADERQNLIEDLNEAGFANPDQPTTADLPLIQARLALIEELLPKAMDQVNADAFREARKDLLEMKARAR